jgi:membrane protease YdiL (CAAX protease family)
MNFIPNDEPLQAGISHPAEPLAQLDPLPGPVPPLAPPLVPPEATRRGIAPLWHTVVLVVGILAFSIWGSIRPDTGKLNPLAPVHTAAQSPSQHTVSNATDRIRLIRYGLTGALELIIVGWVAFGVRLGKTPFRSLFGRIPRDLNSITLEAGVALTFWLCSMLILAASALTWQAVDNQIYQHELKAQQRNQSPSSPKLESPLQKQTEAARQLMDLAPANGVELAAWGFLCILVGFSEELVFRGYLQSQSISLLHRIPISILLTSLIFGAAHGYQGLRGICLITIYGALFSCLTLLRRSLLPGMLAHSWHDFATGLLLAFLRSSHILEHLPVSK